MKTLVPFNDNKPPTTPYRTPAMIDLGVTASLVLRCRNAKDTGKLGGRGEVGRTQCKVMHVLCHRIMNQRVDLSTNTKTQRLTTKNRSTVSSFYRERVKKRPGDAILISLRSTCSVFRREIETRGVLSMWSSCTCMRW